VKTKNLVVGAIVVLLVGALWYRVVYSPMQDKASKAKTATHDADAQAATLRQQIAAEAKRAKAQNVPTETLLTAVPLDAAEASFLRSIDALRVSSGADWQSITPAPPTATGNLATITVGITVQGSEDQLSRYVSGLSELKRLFVLDTLTISASAGNGTPESSPSAAPGKIFPGGRLQMQVSGRIFAQPGAVVAVAGSTGARAATAPAGGAAAAVPAPSR
jgi:Tfp pilus assembly protein PilO